jgi:prepilin-type N-terminal cleavage/methylation domain-containing protein
MKRGFTLIELLIVVAIIAILAAIAVPNFLEAQTRAKVARTVADMRSLATGLESYAVDNNNKYPFDWDSRGWPWYITDVLSTPVSYLTAGALLEDPFRAHLNPQAARRFRYINYPANQQPNAWLPCWTPGPFFTRWGGDTGMTPSVYALGVEAFGLWKITSAGPDKTANTSFSTVELVYDPSNGTISGGDVIRSQKKAGK